MDSRICAINHVILAASPDPRIGFCPWKFEPYKERSCGERGRKEAKRKANTHKLLEGTESAVLRLEPDSERRCRI